MREMHVLFSHTVLAVCKYRSFTESPKFIISHVYFSSWVIQLFINWQCFFVSTTFLLFFIMYCLLKSYTHLININGLAKNFPLKTLLYPQYSSNKLRNYCTLHKQHVLKLSKYIGYLLLLGHTVIMMSWCHILQFLIGIYSWLLYVVGP